MPKKKTIAADADTFEFNGKKYAVNADTIPQVNIPGIGVLTAAEILISPEAQAYLVNEKCVGSVISEVE